MVGQDPVVEGLVAVVELVEEDVLVHVLLEAAQLAVGAGGLLVKGLDGGGEAADESEPTPLLLGESGAAIGQGIGDDGRFGRHAVSSERVKVLAWTGPLSGVSKLERQTHSWGVLPVTPWETVAAVPLSAVDTTAAGSGRCHDVLSRSRRCGREPHVNSKEHCDR